MLGDGLMLALGLVDGDAEGLAETDGLGDGDIEAAGQVCVRLKKPAVPMMSAVASMDIY